MPIYEYVCTACGHTLDTLQKMSDAPLTDCPECNKATLQKVMSASSFQLKGTGWYATDFKNKPQAEPKKTEPKTEAADTAKTTETKPVTASSATATTTTKTTTDKT